MLARPIAEMVKTQVTLGMFVALDATAGGHFMKQQELNVLVEHKKLRHKRYSWCNIGAKDPVTKRHWHRIRRVLTNMQLGDLCRRLQNTYIDLRAATNPICGILPDDV